MSTNVTDLGTTTTDPTFHKALADLGFAKLSNGISYYQSSDSISNNEKATSDPTILIFCSWAFAQPRHIAKYLQPYQTLHPNTSILLIQNPVRNAIYVPDTWQYSFFQPAAAALQSHLASTASPRVLMHIFSNGGAHAAVQLSETCRETCGGLRIPIDALILDSCPGVPRYIPTVNAMVQGAPSRNILVRGSVVAYATAMVCTTGLFEILSIMEPAARKLYRRLYDPFDVFVFKGSPKSNRIPVPRTYIYSKADDMIFEEDVLANADMVERNMVAGGVSSDEAASLVRREEFIGTAHVNHIKGNSDRYWRIVRETWEKRREL